MTSLATMPLRKYKVVRESVVNCEFLSVHFMLRVVSMPLESIEQSGRVLRPVKLN